MSESFKLGTRKSPLALKQVEELVGKFKEIYPQFSFEVVCFLTRGDKDRKTPISEIEGEDFFVDTLEKALLNKEIDFAVHSAKDLPQTIPSGLLVAAITMAQERREALVSKNNLKLSQLPERARVGTSSKKRKESLKQFRPDLEIVDIRGNIEERIELVEKNKVDAIVTAACALKRLGLENKISQLIPPSIIQPHPLQGSLAVEIEEQRNDLIEIFTPLDKRKKILFICRENACRSQLAQGLVNHFFWDKAIAFSCGETPCGEVDSLVREVMKEEGVDISYYESKDCQQLPKVKFDYVISMGCGMRCPTFLQKGAKVINWNIPDPRGKDKNYFHRIKDILREEIIKLLEQ